MRNIFIIILVFFSLLGNATDYYIESGGAYEQYSELPTLSAGDNVYFKRGESFEAITVASSGTSGNPITIGAFGTGDKPKFYGSTEVTGTWSVYSGNIYQASFTGTTISQLFVDDAKQGSARYPNSGYYDITTVNSTTSIASTEISGAIDYTGATICTKTKEWHIDTQEVTSSSGTTINVSSAPSYSFNVGEGFFMFDKLAFLDEAGEWYFDDANNTLYLWVTDSSNPNNSTVRVSTGNIIINVSNEDYVTIENLELTQANQYGVYIEGSTNIVLDSLTINYIEEDGVRIHTGSSYCTVSNCRITNTNSKGIVVRGDHHLVTGNYISNIGLMENIGVAGYGGQVGTGIAFGYNGVGYNTVSYNEVANLGYSGIGFWYCPNITIEYNYIHGGCKTIQDGGGIYCYESNDTEHSDNALIQYNIIDSMIGTLEGHTATLLQADGIYTDNRISYATIENNTITRVSHYGLYLHDNKYVEARYNTIYDVYGGFRATGGYDATDNIIQYNTIANLSGGEYAVTLGILSADETDMIDIDYNDYYAFGITDAFWQASGTYPKLTFAEWQSTMSADANSTFDNSTQTKQDTIILNPSQATLKVYFANDDNNETIGGATLTDSTSISAYESLILVADAFNFTTSTPIDPDPDPEESSDVWFLHQGEPLLYNGKPIKQ